METVLLEKKFNEMGARIKFADTNRWTRNKFAIDVKKDKKGEHFEFTATVPTEVSVIDLQKKDRHLLLLVKDLSLKKDNKFKFLCGHDERSWFTCAIPEKATVSNVFQAKQALKPKILQEIESKEGLKTKLAHKRHRRLASGRKIYRQGEFMFIPTPEFNPPQGSLTAILKNEPMVRGNGSKPHIAEFLYRYGGNQVYISSFNEKSRTVGLTESEYQEAMRSNKNVKMHNWRSMRRDPIVHVKGKICHKDHATLDLGNVWHKVELNTENLAKASKNVVFLD